MSDSEIFDDVQFPPGTSLLVSDARADSANVVLVPIPSADPNDPLNWSMGRKLFNFVLTCYYTLMLFVGMNISGVVYSPLMEDLHVNSEVMFNSSGLILGGMALGCTFTVIFALKFGRRLLYLVSIAVSFGMCILAAKATGASDLYAYNFILGFFGSDAEALCQMTIADIFFVHQRGTMNGIYVLMEMTGSYFGAFIAGFIADGEGWRWIFWWAAIFQGVCLLLFIFGYEETKYIPRTILNASPAPFETTVDSGDMNENEKGVSNASDRPNIPDVTASVLPNIKPNTYLQRLRLLTISPGPWKDVILHIYQPYLALFTIPGIAWVSLTLGSLLAWYSVLLNIWADYMGLPPYNFSPMGIGLMNLAPWIGSILGSMYGGPPTDFFIKKLAKRNGGIYEPEMRLWFILPMVVFMPCVLIWFGTCVNHGLPWPSVAIAEGAFGFGAATLNDICLTYIIDSYRDIVGDAFVAIVFCRNGSGTIIGTTLSKWIAGMGLENMFVLCTCVSFGIFSLIIPMIIWGKKLRTFSAPRYRQLAAKQFSQRR